MHTVPAPAHARPTCGQSVWPRWIAVFVLGACVHAAWGQKLQVRQSTPLRELPSHGAATIKTLQAQALIEGTGIRSGAWLQVITPGGDAVSKHWVYLFDVQTVPEAAPPSSAASQGTGSGLGSVLRGIGQLLQPAAPKRTVSTSTVGIRGLGQEELRQAPPNVQALQTLHNLRTSDESAQQLAQERGWVARLAPTLSAVSAAPSTEAPQR